MSHEIYDIVCNSWDTRPTEDHAFWDSINKSLKRKLIRHDVSDICLLMRDGKIQFISVENWKLIADILDKIKMKKEKYDLNYFRDQLITLKVMENIACGYKTSDKSDENKNGKGSAFEQTKMDIANKMDCSMGSETIRDIYYNNVSNYKWFTMGKGKNETPDFVKQIRDNGAEIQAVAKATLCLVNPKIGTWEMFSGDNTQ